MWLLWPASFHRPPSAHRSAEPNARPSFPSASGRPWSGPACISLVMVAWGICPAAAAELDLTVTATWNGVSLRDWTSRISRISETAGLPVLVDIRLDPDTTISLDCRDEPLKQVLGRAAALAGGELAVLKSSFQIAPPGVAEKLIRAEAARMSRLTALPPRQRALLTAASASHWPAGARPRDLIAAMAADAGITIRDVDRIPHDHLPGLLLPKLSLGERLDLLLSGYDLRIDWQAAQNAAGMPTGCIIPLAADLPPTAAATLPPTPMTKPTGRRPNAELKPAAAMSTFSLKVAAPLDQVLAAIAARLGLTLELDRESLTRRGIAPNEIVRADIKDATREQLLDAILNPLTLERTIDGGTLRVFARP